MSPAPPIDGPVLALETSGPMGSVALAVDGDVVASVELLERRQQASAIIPAIRLVLEEAGYGPDDLTGIVVGSGPGSFTGVRVAAATAKGLAHALAVPLWALSSLAAAAVSDLAPSPRNSMGGQQEDDALMDRPVRCVIFDARGERVYAGCYRVSADDLEELMPPSASRLGDILEGPLPGGVTFTGDAAVRHAERIRAEGHFVLGPPCGRPTAEALLSLMALQPTEAPVPDPASWEPSYLRAWRSGPETAR